METVNVKFDELSAMVSEQRSFVITLDKPSKGDLDHLFKMMYDDYMGNQPDAQQNAPSTLLFAAPLPQNLITPPTYTRAIHDDELWAIAFASIPEYSQLTGEPEFEKKNGDRFVLVKRRVNDGFRSKTEAVMVCGLVLETGACSSFELFDLGGVVRELRQGQTEDICGPSQKYPTNIGKVPLLLSLSSHGIDLLFSVGQTRRGVGA
ncbi:hypothetical protein Tco_0260225 [Tanacetum coccineum]